VRGTGLRLWPRSLAGQMALLVALALFVAQAINFALLLRERRAFLIEQVTGPAITRVIDAIERTAQGRGPVADRGRVRRLPSSEIMPGMISLVAVKAGQRVKKGDPLLAIEAMKMETQIRADREAVIDQVLVSRGTAVNAHDLLVTLKPG